MGKYLSVLCLLVCASSGVLKAQQAEATVGVPFSYDYAAAIGLSQILALYAEAGITFTYSWTGGTGLPPGLTVSPSGVISGTPTQAGEFQFNLNFSYAFTAPNVNYSGTAPFPGFLLVTGSSGPPVEVIPGALNFSLTKGSATTATQSIVITNHGDQTQTFSVSAATDSGGDWLSVSPSSGSVAPFSSTSVTVNAAAGSLNAGTYLGSVSGSVSPANQPVNVSVIATVSGGEAELRLSQSGLFFQTVEGGGTPPSQSINVLNAGEGTLNFSVSTSTVSGGTGWLSATPASGSATAKNAATVTISIDSSKLKAGDYYGQVQIAAAGVANSPQTVSIVLKVAAANVDLGASVYPTGLIFVAQAGGSDPAAKTISLTNPSPSTLTFNAGTSFGQATSWFTVQPPSAPVNATNPVTITVQPKTAGLAAGIYVGDILLTFAEDNSSRHVAVLLIVVPGSTTTKMLGAAASRPAAASNCTPTKLIPVFTQLGSGFSTVAAWPTPIEATIVDDCGTLLTAGSAVASFSNSDPALPLTSLNDGRWSATWQPQHSSAQVTITVQAEEAKPPLQGTQSIGGALQDNPTTPSVGGVGSPAKSTPTQPLSPGSFISIYGLHLGAGQNQALSLPLATELGATQVVLGGRALPLLYAADGQVNAVIPYDVPPNSTQQLIVTNGPALSVPAPVTIASTGPAVFATLDGFGIVDDFKPGSKVPVRVDANHPISAGDALVIYCAGLGPVNPPVTAGNAAPSSPPSTTTNPVTVTIGGKPAQVFFSGLVGGLAGEYQVNAYVPKGIAPGNAVPLVVSVAGFNSSPVTVAVK